MKEFKIIVDGVEKTAEVVTKLDTNIGISYVYYYIKEDNDTEETEKELLASIVVPDGDNNEKIIGIESEEEKKFAFQIYSDYYKKNMNK